LISAGEVPCRLSLGNLLRFTAPPARRQTLRPFPSPHRTLRGFSLRLLGVRHSQSRSDGSTV
jgi:hypothetical protein